MPTAVTERPYRPVPGEPPRKRWTRREYEAMEKSGLWNHERLELIDGVVITKMPKNRPHVIVFSILYAWLLRVFGEDYVNGEAPIDVALEDNPTSEPEPDLIVLARPSLEIQDNNPSPVEICLVIEKSDSTLGFDLTTKASLYARAGISDYWVLDIPARRLIVHRDPQNGLYKSITAYCEHEAVAPLSAPSQEFQVGRAFPPRR
jgi:Uma2 family endonuclease